MGSASQPPDKANDVGHSETPSVHGLLNRLDGLSPWSFTGTLYVARWMVVVPIAYLIRWTTASSGTSFEGSAVVLLFGFLFLAPVSETLLECALPYWLLQKLGQITVEKRPWRFVVISAALMALLHLSSWPAAILPSLVTGSFLAYTYGHFAPHGAGFAFLHASVFHAGINIVGWLLIFAT